MVTVSAALDRDPVAGPEKQFVYKLYPLGALHGSIIVFHRIAGGGMTLAYTSPDAEGMARERAEWFPQGYARSQYRDTISQAECVLALLRIIP